jgi:RND superfamily putative drug exporter
LITGTLTRVIYALIINLLERNPKAILFHRKGSSDFLSQNRSRFDPFNNFIRKYHRWIIVAWILALVASVTLIPSFFSGVSYNIADTNLGGPKNQEGQVALNLLNEQFPSSNSNSSSNSILLVVQPKGGSNVYSDELKNSLLALNQTFAKDPNVVNFTGVTAIYTTEYGLLNSTVPGFLSGTSALSSNVSTINKSLYSLQANLTSLSSRIFQLKQGINQTSQLVYGIPSSFVSLWESFIQKNYTTSQANTVANSTIYPGIVSEGPQTLGYYTTFYGNWSSSFSNPSLTPEERETSAVNSSITQFVQSPQVNASTRALIESVATRLNVTNWNQNYAITNLTLTSISSQIPSTLYASLGISSSVLVQDLYNLGPSPSNSELGSLTVTLITNSYSSSSGSTSSNSTISIPELINSSYAVGASPNSSAVWNLAAHIFSDATQSSFSNSPLFTVNATSLSHLLSGLTNSSTQSQINNAIERAAYVQSYSSYPLILSTSLTKNFVSSDNRTMLVLYDFSFGPSSETIASFRNDVSKSNISTLATTYVTGGNVVSDDLSKVFSPALGVTVAAGVVVSIIIVGLLFFAPLAALIPLMIGGISIGIAYAAIYLGIVILDKGTITFLTPTLTTLLMLGLAVDYSVLQMRRTKEERTNGRSKEDSVSTSVRWAGQAVLTAGITVIVAYVVMAVANVPLFSDVGTAIALGVTVLLAASLTLLPSLELSLGDKLFWPSLRRRNSTPKPSMLARISKKTIKYKVVVAVVVTIFAAMAVYATVSTPTGLDFLKLIPNFQSNQGLNVISSSLGSSTVAPTVVLVTTPTQIVNNHNQFNTTLLNEIEQISSTAASTPGVVSVTSPTRPYGSTFNYSSVNNLSEPLHSQYLSGMISQIGKDNKTALITVGLSSSSESAQAVSALLKLKSNVNSLNLPMGTQVYYGGDTQNTYDSQSFLNGILPQVIIILAAAVFVILLIQLRSVFTPLRLVFTILCSVAFSLALLSLVFYYVLNLPVFDFAPLFVVVTMLGVGIDYDIFYVTRIREEVLNGKSDDEAITTATTKVWVTIFGLGLVLSSVFGSLLLTNIAMLQEISAAVAAAVLIDISVVILFFVPSLMAIAERFNWWPSRLGRRDESKTVVQ